MEKPFALFLTSKTQKGVTSVSGKLTTLGLLFVENKDWTKAEIGEFFFFNEKITLKHLKILGHPTRESAFKFKSLIVLIDFMVFWETMYPSPNPCLWSVYILSENINKTFDVFRRYRKRPVAWNGLIIWN